MDTSRSTKRKRGPAKPHQVKTQLTPEQILPGKLHHSLQEFRRLAKQAKVNETQIIVKKLKSLRSSDDKKGKAKNDPTEALQDLEAQLIALKALNLVHFAAAALIQKLKHNRTLSADKTVSKFISTELQPSLPLTYYTVEPNSAEGKIRNRLTSCKSFSGRASELVTDLQAILDPSVTKSSSITASHTATVDEEEEDSEDQAGDGEGEDDFFDQAESSDAHLNDDGWESGSIHSQHDDPSTGQWTMSTGFGSESGSEPEPGSTSDVDPPGHSGPKTQSKVKLKPKSVSGDDNNGSSLDSDSHFDSDSPLHSSLVQGKVPKPSRGAGTSTFLPSLSVGYIPGTGDSDPEGELEAIEGKNERKNRRGQRARRAIWEKKYGKGAKHVVKRQEEETEKKRVKEEKRRQREATAKRPHWATKKVFEPPKQTDSGYGGRIAVKSGGGSGGGRMDGQPLLKKPRREDKALHPSWEAKKKMKEKESAAIIPPAGKKIVF
ncbi:Bud-site selection protein [Thelephora ganbajun]|uniref:Bud-site selection protein n=1 Tax=Thelephora ganbajun TaxID=370292 RepID=A0ACB6ZEL4_THEGA|nr:Bud-site selection protein [Thelephora ganbajun]